MSVPALRFPREFQALVDGIVHRFKIFRNEQTLRLHIKHLLEERERWEQIIPNIDREVLNAMDFTADTTIQIMNSFLDLVENIILEDSNQPLHAHASKDHKLFIIDRRGILVVAGREGSSTYTVSTVFRPTPLTRKTGTFATVSMFFNDAVAYVMHQDIEEYHTTENWLDSRLS